MGGVDPAARGGEGPVMGGGLRGAVGPQWVPASALQRARSRSVRGGWGSDPIAGLWGGARPIVAEGSAIAVHAAGPPRAGLGPASGSGSRSAGRGLRGWRGDGPHRNGPHPPAGTGSRPGGVWVPPCVYMGCLDPVTGRGGRFPGTQLDPLAEAASLPLQGWVPAQGGGIRCVCGGV